MSALSNGEDEMTTTPRIAQVAREEVAEFSERYGGYHEDLVSALNGLVRQQAHTTDRQRQDYLQKVIENLGERAIKLGRNDR